MKTTMLLRVAATAILCGTLTASRAQRGSQLPMDPIQVGTLSINAGAGIGVPYKGSIGVPLGGKTTVNWGVVDLGFGVITLGLSTGGSFSHGSSEGTTETTSRIFVQARGAWHYGWFVPGLDLYAGLSSGFAADRFHYGDPVDNTNRSVHLLAGIFAGVSYFVTPGFGFNAEAGDDITILQLGLVAKFR